MLTVIRQQSKKEEKERAKLSHWKDGGEKVDAGRPDTNKRRLCPDGSCVGLLDSDDKCKICGRLGTAGDQMKEAELRLRLRMLRNLARPAELTPAPTEKDKPAGKSRYIPWAELLRKTFGFELLCSKCKGPLHLVALIKSEDVAKKILTAMHLPTEVPELHPARPPPGTAAVAGGEDGSGESWLN